jgi:hypothetical protein
VGDAATRGISAGSEPGCEERPDPDAVIGVVVPSPRAAVAWLASAVSGCSGPLRPSRPGFALIRSCTLVTAVVSSDTTVDVSVA